MRVLDTPLTPALRAWLAAAHDDGAPALLVRADGPDLLVERADGAPLSPAEAREVIALLAAHAVEPLRPLPPL